MSFRQHCSRHGQDIKAPWVLYNSSLAMQIRPGIQLASLSDIGCQRENNEDNYSYWEPASEEQFARKGRLAIIADGMGGYEGGQEASHLAIEAIEEVYAQATEGDPQAWLINGFFAAHQRIVAEADLRPELQGMGTTCTAAALLGHELYFAHLGDSRLYLIRDHSITRLTRDHSYVGRLIEHGLLRAEEAEAHPQRHILTAALGAGMTITPDFPERPIDLETGDTLLLCTDGLWGLLKDSELLQTVDSHELDEACRQLVATAKERGGPDNITVQLLRITSNGRN